MSSADTGHHQRRRLDDLGLRTGLLPELTDVDEPGDVATVAAAAPGSRFAAVAAELATAAGDRR